MDLELTDRARQGDAGAVASIIAESRPRLMAVAYSILRDHDLADEATQRALIAIWQHLPRLRQVERYQAWSYRLVVNACNAELRRGRRIRALAPDLMMVQPSFADDLGLVAERDQLDRAFLRLPVRQRAVVALRFHAGLSTERVAEVLGLPVGTVHSRLHRAMDVLRGAIDADARGASVGPAGDHPGSAGATARATPWLPEALRAWPGSLGARRIVVALDGSGDARSISEALDVAEDGDIILVRPGRYRDTPVVRKHVAIVGDGEAGDVVVDFRDGPARHWCGARSHPNCVTPVGLLLEGVGARISNLTLVGPQHGVGILSRGGAPTITHVSADLEGMWPGLGHTHHLIYMVDAGAGTISDCTSRGHVHLERSSPLVERNDLTGALGITGVGSHPLVRENTIVIRERTRMCLGIRGGAEPVIERNVFSWIDGSAISIWDAARATVRDNVVRESQTGIIVSDRGGGSLEGNEIDARTTAIHVHGTEPIVSGNAIRGARATPLVVTGGGRPTLERNRVDGGDGPTVRAVEGRRSRD